MRKRPLTFTLIALSVAWTVWIMFSSQTGESWRRFGISNGIEVFNGDYWTLFFSIFVHLGLLHLFFNTYWLYILGGYLEERYGWKFYALLVLVSGACGSVLELSFAGNTGVGLSGVVYAIFGFLWGVKMFGKESMPLLPAQTIQVFMIWLVVCIFTTASGLMSVGNVAHVTGLVLGLLTALSFYSRNWAVRSLPPLLVAFCVLALFYSPWSKEWLSSKALRAHQAHRLDAAEGYYSRLLTLDPGNYWALENRGRIRLFLGHAAEGQADLDRAEELKSHEK